MMIGFRWRKRFSATKRQRLKGALVDKVVLHIRLEAQQWNKVKYSINLVEG
jgi:hypothetical protein